MLDNFLGKTYIYDVIYMAFFLCVVINGWMTFTMRITKDDVEKVAKLAKLQLSEEEKERFRGDLEQILGYVDKLSEVDTESVVPTEYGHSSSTTLREDRIEPSLPQDEAIRNAPEQKDGFFRVPKVIPVNSQNPKNHKNRSR